MLACLAGGALQEYIRDQKRLQLRIAGAGRLQWSLIKSIKNSKASQSQAALVRQSAIAMPPASHTVGALTVPTDCAKQSG